MWGLLLTCLSWVGLSPIPYIASLIGTTEPAVKLLISILMAYPIAIIYHKVFKHKENLRNLYFIITGLDIALYNFGLTFYHNMIPIIVIYISTAILGPGKYNAIVTFLFNMTYLLVGYVWTESEDYDITWTMPHCVLTLKLIALGFDLWDGEKMKKGEVLSFTNQKTALTQSPTLPELIGFVYFPPCFLVGPIFSFRRYSDFISDKFPTDDIRLEKEAFKRLCQGIVYLAAFQIGGSVFNMQYMASDEFWNQSIFYRHYYCGLWAHFALYKYISCWLLTEASAIRSGLSYNGTVQIAAGKPVTIWDGCSNIKLVRFESATTFQHYIDSFNCNTNHFAAEYVYKRLKFLGSRQASQFCTLFFLALWHGIRSGYYLTFLNEFLIIYMEKEFKDIIQKLDIYEKLWTHNVSKYLLYALLKTYTIVFMGWSLVPFDVKVFSKWWSIYCSLYFSGFVLFLPWAFVHKPLLLYIIKKFNLRCNDKSKIQ